ncbi:hypothetical protein L2E82_11312 [Cichorium intybus]|uniref:Uncharacterized protein n=1 Tax=Cichorium intybus TaxID=13427 RepID=A0ACB9GDP2_CICIN|nr:hypothetical protein L2E82_11312 [Cichorium intybus]
MAGIGKTTLAEHIYMLHRSEFERSSFVEDIGRRCAQQTCSQLDLQKQLLGTSKIGKGLPRKKTLFVLDDVDNSDQLDILIGTKGFHPALEKAKDLQHVKDLKVQIRDQWRWGGAKKLPVQSFSSMARIKSTTEESHSPNGPTPYMISRFFLGGYKLQSDICFFLLFLSLLRLLLLHYEGLLYFPLPLNESDIGIFDFERITQTTISE